MDERILQPGADALPFVRRCAEWRDGFFERGIIVAAHMQHGSECDRLLHAGLLAKLFRERDEAGPGDAPRRETHVRYDFIHRAVREQIAV